MRRALITGISGQDGSYLAELLFEKGYEVHGTVRKGSDADSPALDRLQSQAAVRGGRLFLHPLELSESAAFTDLLKEAAPDELYHLAGQSDVAVSFKLPEVTAEVTGMATLRLLEAVRASAAPPRVFYASSSQVFGQPQTAPQDEATPFAPVNPYGCAKAFATQMAAVYRRAFGLFICNGIMFNHESPRRGMSFLTRKVCRAAAAIRLGLQEEVLLGDLSAQRDWGHARDFVLGMWLMLQQEAADDFVLATGELHSVQEVVELAFRTVDLDWRRHVKQDPGLLRPAEPSRLVGNPAKAKRVLGWKPQTSFEDLISEMTRAEMESLAETKPESP